MKPVSAVGVCVFGVRRGGIGGRGVELELKNICFRFAPKTVKCIGAQCVPKKSNSKLTRTLLPRKVAFRATRTNAGSKQKKVNHKESVF